MYLMRGDPRPISIIGFADDHAMKKSFIPTLEDDEEVCISQHTSMPIQGERMDGQYEIENE